MSVVTQSRLPKLENVCLECAEIFIEWFIHIASLLAQVSSLTLKTLFADAPIFSLGKCSLR